MEIKRRRLVEALRLALSPVRWYAEHRHGEEEARIVCHYTESQWQMIQRAYQEEEHVVLPKPVAPIAGSSGCTRCQRVGCAGPHDRCRGMRVYRIMRTCCTAGLCTTCWPFPRRPDGQPPGRLWVEQMRTVDREFAEQVVRNWRTYDARLEEVP